MLLFTLVAALGAALLVPRAWADPLVGPEPDFQPQVLALYGAYETQLKQLRAGGWSRVPDERTLRPGMRSEAILALRHRLAASGDGPALPSIQTDALLEFDAPLAAAVARFQRRHGLDPDGIAGRRTLQALNVSAADRLRQLALNLSRWQQVPITAERSLVLVNIPEFRARLYRDGVERLTMRAVVGKRSNPTPELREPLNRIVLNPTWFVPARIGRKEVLPKAIADPNYLSANGFRAYVNRAPVAPSLLPSLTALPEASTVRFRQGPGPGNALGRVKFVLPNERGIYLHDTPARGLFEQPVRAFSHGCVRLEEPLKLARTLLRDSAGWTAARVDRQLRSDRTVHLTLEEEVPVYLQYLTAKVINGQVHYFDDLYGRDETLLEKAALGSDSVALIAALRHHHRALRKTLAAQERGPSLLPPASQPPLAAGGCARCLGLIRCGTAEPWCDDGVHQLSP